MTIELTPSRTQLNEQKPANSKMNHKILEGNRDIDLTRSNVWLNQYLQNSKTNKKI